jgi:hypothetical protein
MTGYEIVPFQSEEDRDYVLQHVDDTSKRRVDILWLSETEFVTRHDIKGSDNNEIYSYTILVHGSPCFELRAFSILQFDNSGLGTLGPSPNLPLNFLRRIWPPSLRWLSEIIISFRAHPHVDTLLPFVPSAARTFRSCLTVQFVNPSEDLLRALSSHPVHEHVLLRLEIGEENDMTLQTMNDRLLEFRHPIHLQIPSAFLEFDSTEEPFSTNPAFTTLTIKAGGSQLLSSKLLDGMASYK